MKKHNDQTWLLTALALSVLLHLAVSGIVYATQPRTTAPAPAKVMHVNLKPPAPAPQPPSPAPRPLPTSSTPSIPSIPPPSIPPASAPPASVLIPVIPAPPPPKPPEPKPPAVKPPEKSPDREVVDLGPKKPDDHTPPPDDAKYLAQRNMRTEHETVNPTRSRTGSPGNKPAEPNLNGESPEQTPAKPSKGMDAKEGKSSDAEKSADEKPADDGPAQIPSPRSRRHRDREPEAPADDSNAASPDLGARVPAPAQPLNPPPPPEPKPPVPPKPPKTEVAANNPPPTPPPEPGPRTITPANPEPPKEAAPKRSRHERATPPPDAPPPEPPKPEPATDDIGARVPSPAQPSEPPKPDAVPIPPASPPPPEPPKEVAPEPPKESTPEPPKERRSRRKHEDAPAPEAPTEVAKLELPPNTNPTPTAPPPPKPDDLGARAPSPAQPPAPPSTSSTPSTESTPPPPDSTVPERSSRRRHVPVQVAMNDTAPASKGRGHADDPGKDGKGKNDADGKGNGKDPNPSSDKMAVSMSDLAKSSGADNGSIDHLPGVKRGEITSLNAKEYTYAAFYNQVKKIIRFHWNYLTALRAMGFQDEATIPSISVTVLMVLNRDGSLDRVEVVSPSGYSIWDATAVQAIRAAAPFYNLPPALLDQSGKFSYTCRFFTY